MKSQRPAVIEILTTSIMARNQQPLTQSTWVITSPSPRKRLYLKLPIVMQHVEERALATCRQTIPLWLRYVDDTFTAVHKDEIDDFHDHLNEQNADIQFTKEIEENGKLPSLDCLVSRDNNELRTTVYRKPTHTDRLLDQSSYNPDFTQSHDYKDFDETSATSL